MEKYKTSQKWQKASNEKNQRIAKLRAFSLTSNVSSSSIDELDDEELLDKITSNLFECVYLILNKVLIEFFTLNLYPFVKSKLSLVCEREIQVNKIILSKLETREQVEFFIIDLIRSDEHLRDQLVQTSIRIYSTEAENLKQASLCLIKKRFYKVFSNPCQAKFLLKLNTKKARIVHNDLELIRKKSLTNLDSSNAINAGPYAAIYRLFGKLLVFKLFFPTLVYNKDLNNNRSCLYNALKEGTKANRFIKSLVGISSAWFITFLIYFYLRYLLKIEAQIAMIAVTVCFLVLLIGLTFDNTKFRCITLLLMPLMISNRGRTLLLMRCYQITQSFILPNLFHNLQMLEYGFSCNANLLEHHTIRLLKKHSMVIWLLASVEKIQRECARIVQFFESSKALVKTCLNYVKKALKLIQFVFSLCSETYGDPNKMCNDFIYEFHLRCAHNLSCALVPILYALCPALNYFQSHCKSVLFVFGSIWSKFKFQAVDTWDRFVDHMFDPIIDEFKFNVSFDKELMSNFTSDKNHKQIAADISSAYMRRLESLNVFLFKMNFVFPVSFFLIVLSAIVYHYKYLNRNNHENYVIGVRFYELEEKRRASGQRAVLPLEAEMRSKFVELFDLTLTQVEKSNTFFSVFLLTICLLPIFFSMSMDHAIVDVNRFVANNTAFQLTLQPAGRIDIQVDNYGFMASVYRSLFNTFNEINNIDDQMQSIHNFECLPQPKNINQKAHSDLKWNFLFLYVLICVQPYIKRWMTVLAGSFYPEQDQIRSVWLHKTLLSLNVSTFERIQTDGLSFFHRFVLFLSSFFKKFCNSVYYFTFKAVLCLVDAYSRRLKSGLLSKKIKLCKKQIVSVIMAHVSSKENKCERCQIEVNCKQAKEELVKCQNFNCMKSYCANCYVELDNLCGSCKIPLIKEDFLDDESVENDSSDEEQFTNFKSDKHMFEKENEILENYFRCFVDGHQNEPIAIDYQEFRVVYEQDKQEEMKKIEAKLQVEKYSLADALQNHFRLNQNALKYLNEESKFHLKLLKIDKRRIQKLIDAEFEQLYFQLKSCMQKADDFQRVFNTYWSDIEEIFQLELELTENIVQIVIDNFMDNFQIEELFNLDNLDLNLN